MVKKWSSWGCLDGAVWRVFLLYIFLVKIVTIVDKECSNNQVQRSEVDYMIDPAMLLGDCVKVKEGVFGEEGQ